MRLDGTRRRSVPSGRSAPRACASGRRRLRVRPPPSPPRAPTPFSRVAPNDSPTSPPTSSLPSPPASLSSPTALRATAPHRASAHRPAAASTSTFVRTPPSRLSPVSPFPSQALRQPISAVTAGSPQHSAQTSVTHTHTRTHTHPPRTRLRYRRPFDQLNIIMICCKAPSALVLRSRRAPGAVPAPRRAATARLPSPPERRPSTLPRPQPWV